MVVFHIFALEPSELYVFYWYNLSADYPYPILESQGYWNPKQTGFCKPLTHICWHRNFCFLIWGHEGSTRRRKVFRIPGVSLGIPGYPKDPGLEYNPILSCIPPESTIQEKWWMVSIHNDMDMFMHTTEIFNCIVNCNATACDSF